MATQLFKTFIAKAIKNSSGTRKPKTFKEKHNQKTIKNKAESNYSE